MTKIPVFLCRILAAGLGLAAAVPAQELVTDRPDQTESATVVPAGSLQIEVGLQAAGDEDGRRALEGPATLLRWGLGRAWELRLGWDGVIRTEVDGRTVADGAGDTEIGAKVRLVARRRLEAALLAGLSLPTGEDDLSSRRADPSLRLALGRELTSALALGLNLGLARASGRDSAGRVETDTEALYTVALGYGLTRRWGVFAESFGAIGLGGAAEGPRHSVDGGLTWLLRDRLQLDAFAGAGLSSAADGWFAGLGLSVRRDPR